MTVELTDVVVVGSGYGGAIPAYHLAAGGAKVVVLERGAWYTAADFRHSLQLGTYNRYMDMIVGDGIGIFAGNCVGGSTVVNLAAGVRAPSFVFDRVGSFGTRLWPSVLSRAALDPWYDVVEESLPVTKLDWEDVSYAGGVFAAACHRAGRTCNPVPVMVDLKKCTNCGFMFNGCTFDAKRSMLLNYLPAATAHGAVIRPLHEVQYIAPATTPGYQYRLAYNVMDASGAIISNSFIETKIVVLGAGAVATPVILQRSAQTLGPMPFAVGKFMSTNGDLEASFVLDENKIRTLLKLARSSTVAFEASHIGRNITAMSFDGLDPAAPEFTRFSLQQVFDTVSSVVARANPGRASWFGVEKKQMRRDWASWLTVLCMVEDDNEGAFGPPPPVGAYTRISPAVAQANIRYHPTANTMRAYSAAMTELKTIMTKDGLATEVNEWSKDVIGLSTLHPLSSARIGDNTQLSALNSNNELRGYAGIFVTDASAVPTSLCVNPSLTISALAERAIPNIVKRARQFGVTVEYGAGTPDGSITTRNVVMSTPEVQRALA